MNNSRRIAIRFAKVVGCMYAATAAGLVAFCWASERRAHNHPYGNGRSRPSIPTR